MGKGLAVRVAERAAGAEKRESGEKEDDEFRSIDMRFI